MADLETLATGIHADLGRQFSWDGGLDTALLTFESAESDEVVGIIERHLKTTWTSDTIDDAPDVVRDLIRGLGGLRSGQWISHSELDGPFLVAIFWPWGGGSPISLRIGVVGGDDEALKGWMGVS